MSSDAGGVAKQCICATTIFSSLRAPKYSGHSPSSSQVKSINGQPTASHDGAAVDVLALLIKQNVFRFVFEIDTEPRPLPAKPSAASGKRRKISPECKAPTDEKAAPTQAKAAPASKALKPSKPAPHPLEAEEEVKRQKLLAKQSKQLADLKAKKAAELAAFEASCKKEQVNASGASKCAYCGSMLYDLK